MEEKSPVLMSETTGLEKAHESVKSQLLILNRIEDTWSSGTEEFSEVKFVVRSMLSG